MFIYPINKSFNLLILTFILIINFRYLTTRLDTALVPLGTLRSVEASSPASSTKAAS